MLPYNVRKISCLLALTMTSSLTPFVGIYADSCDSLSTNFTAVAFSSFTPTIYFRFAYTPPTSPYELSIPLSAYSTMIGDILTGDTTLGYFTFPMCVGATTGPNTWDPYSGTGSPQMDMNIVGTPAANNPNANGIQLTGPSGANSLAAGLYYCPCGGGSCTVDNVLPISVPSNNTSVPLKGGGAPFGTCQLNSGYFYIKIYSTPGQIPAVGNYSTDTTGLTIQAQPAN